VTRIERVDIRRVVKTFGATAALRGVSAELRAGALTIVEGPNGSGKSTLLRVVGTILRPTSGGVDYAPLGRDLDRVREQIGWVSHEALAYADLTGKENIFLAAELHGIRPQEAWERARERFELGRFAERALRTNSRGQRQRVALARALVHEPSLVLLDEPSTGLDKSGVARLVELVEREIADGAIVALVTHEPELFAGLPSTRLSLRRGQVVD
jgi:heme exporter protein A